jgi:addiction module RelE/StbE family toxin
VIRVAWDPGFKKSYQKKIKHHDELKKRFWKAMELFSKNPFAPRLRTHKLTGKLEGLWAFSVAYDSRVVFQFLNEKEVLLIDIGTHDEVY